MNMMFKRLPLVCGLAVVLGSSPAMALVSAEQAAQLGNTLTPTGAERAGNADGSIPEWTGGITKPPAGYQVNGKRIDPFADEKPLFSITAANYKDYADQLSAGLQVLFARYPDSFRMDVYPTHRSHSQHQWQYDNIKRNATEAKLTEDGNGVINAYGGVPFPIPQNGSEVIWNHLLRYAGTATDVGFTPLVVYPNGTTQRTVSRSIWQSPYYLENGRDNFSGSLLNFVNFVLEPTRRKGELILLDDPLNATEKERAAWQYIPGQRRVRRAPTIAYDTPDASASGLATYDDSYMFNGSPDRYDWKLIGKKEMYIPYNTYKMQNALADGYSEEDIATPKHLNPDFQRWEKHRVWVVEATVKPGARHAYAKRVVYIDEDSWYAVLQDRYDGRGTLWRTSMYHTYNTYENIGTLGSSLYQIDLINGAYITSLVKEQLQHVDPKPAEFFSPQNLRKLGQR